MSKELKLKPGETLSESVHVIIICYEPNLGYQDVILSPHLPTGGMSQPQESKHSFGEYIHRT